MVRASYFFVVIFAFAACSKASAPSEGAGSARMEDLRAFPWPPPEASARVLLPEELFEAHGPFHTFGDADRVLHAALAHVGYPDEGYYWVPGGFALATRMEHIYADGTPREDRWSLGPKPTRWSLADYLRALFTANPGYYRVLVFVVTDATVTESERHPTPEEAQQWLHGGANDLPLALRSQGWRPGVKCSVLVYEFVREQEQQPKQIDGVSGRDHLVAAGIWSALQ